MVTVTLKSAPLCHTPGLLAWAKNGYKFNRDRRSLTRVISDTYGLTPQVARGLLDGSIPYVVVDDTVQFETEGGKFLKEIPQVA